MNKKNNAGAIASNAGDDFHLIWACKKLLDILNPNSEMTAISVEGPTWADSVLISEEEALYSIDLAEYYCGTNFEEANRVVFSQLKYSTYQMDKPWTAAALCAKTSKTKNNSIIRRLADTYGRFASEHANSIEKLTLKLVSNRKLQTDFLASITDAICILQQQKYTRTADLLKKVSPEHRDDIEMLYNTSHLPSTSFVCFLLALNFDDCGTSIRSIHQAEIIKQLGKWSVGNLHNKYSLLISDIREKMLPEHPKGIPMVKEDILAALETSSMDMFPAPSKIESLPHIYIERDMCSTILDCLKSAPPKTICIQATAGIGKTTFADHIKDFLPEGSVTVLYDCYGGGSFLQDCERRHLSGVAIPQICNTLAAECGTDWLLGRTMEEYEYWRALEKSLNDAVGYIREQNPEAVVTVIIDAADNSMMAADFFEEKCFLVGLLRMQLPEGVCLIVTTRTERAHLLRSDHEVYVIDLPAFGFCESTMHLRSVFKNASDQQCEEFHQLTGGNPRLQSYLLAGSSSIDDVLVQKKLSEKTVDGLFKEFIRSVELNYRSLLNPEALFYAISVLPRPIPTSILRELGNISIEILQSISVECRGGFYISGANVLLRDEDFEDFIKRNYGSSQETINSIAEYMYVNRNSDPYCARYVHLFLNQADRFEDLIEIALDEHISDNTIGIAQISDIMRQRIQLTLKRPEMSDPTNNLLACKLVYRLIDYNANEDMLRDFLSNSPDEALLYCDEMSVRNIFRTKSNDFESLAKAAFVFSHFPAFHDDAWRYIDSYMAEVRHYFSTPTDRRGLHSRPDTSNIIRIAQAMLKLGAKEKAINWLCGWKPKIVETKHIFELFSKLLSHGYTEYCDLLISQKWTSPNKLAIVCAYISLGKEPPKNYVDYLLRLFKRFRIIPDKRFGIYQLLLFSEYIFSAEGKETAAELIEKFPISKRFSSVPSLHMDTEKQEFLYFLRYCALRHFCKGETIDSDSYWIDGEATDFKRSKENKQSFKQLVDFLSPLCLLRLSCMQSVTDLFAICTDTVQNLDRQAWSYSSYNKYHLFEIGLLIFSEAICCAKTFSSYDIYALTESVLSIHRTSPQFKLKLLDILSRNTLATNASFFVLHEIDSCYKDYPASAREMTEVFLSCAQMSRRIHTDLGEEYFRKALNSTKGQDYESYRKLYLYKTLSEKVCSTGEDSPELAYNIVRLSEDFCRKQGDTKNFPYEEAVGAAALLSPKSIWGTLCRLDDRDNYDGFALMDTIPIVLDTLLEAGKLSAKDTTALTGLLLPDRSSQYNELADTLLSKISTWKPSEQKPILEILMHDVLYNIPMDEKQHRSLHLSRFLETNVIDPELDTEKINAMSNFLQRVSKNEPYYHQEEPKAVSSIDIKQFVTEHNIMSKQDLKDCLRALKEPDRNSFIKVWMESREPDQYVSSLALILDVIGEDYSYGSSRPTLEIIAAFVDFVKEWPEVNRWRNNPAIQQYYLQLFAKDFLHLYIGYEDSCDALLRIFPADYQVQVRAFSNYVANHPNLYDEQLVKAICRICMALSVEDATMLLQWTTENEMRHIHPISGDVKPYDAMKKGVENSFGNMSSFVWRLLGHKDKGMRWKAAHVLLRATSLGNLDITRDISEFYDHPLSEWYMDEDNYFFVDSAKLWYLVSCSRISKMNPENLLPLYPLFKEIALASGVMHALQRRLAKDICLILAPLCDPDTVEQFILCDKCIPSKSGSTIPRYQREQLDSIKKLKFHFDTMNTLPYWYIHVANIFSCTQAQVAGDCDYYIAQFGITNEDCDAWQHKYLSQDDYPKIYNDHGTIPTVETLFKYAEWHSMFYVADKYRQTMPMSSDACEAYEDWINDYVPGIDGFWYSEFRNHVPLIPFLWNFELTTTSDPEQRHIIPEGLERSLIDNELGLSLEMEYWAHMHNCSRRISIQSALIKKDHVKQLVEKLKEPYTAFYDFYFTADKYSYRNRQPEFFIYPTCDELFSYSGYAVDKKDLLLKDYLSYFVGASEFIRNWLGVSRKDLILYSRIYESADFPINAYHWSEPEAESGYEKHSTSGKMVIINRECLLDLLRTINQSIVYYVEVDFKDDNFNFHGTPRKPAKTIKLISLTLNEKNTLEWEEYSLLRHPPAI